jgi:hypothetical protein
MICGRVLCVTVLALALLGCRQSRSTQSVLDPGSDWVEYVKASPDYGVRVLLDSRGAARVDFLHVSRYAVMDRVHTILLPASAKEIDRVIEATAALAGSSLPDPMYPQDKGGNSSSKIAIRCQKNGQIRTIRITPDQEFANFVWTGLRDEIEFAGLVDVAKAVDAQHTGEDLLSRGDREHARGSFADALRAIVHWETVRSHRYGYIWEGLRGWYPVGATRYYFDQVPDPSTLGNGIKEMTLDTKMELMRSMSGDLLGHSFVVSESDGISVANLNPKMVGLDPIKAPGSIPTRLVDALKRLPEHFSE